MERDTLGLTEQDIREYLRIKDSLDVESENLAEKIDDFGYMRMGTLRKILEQFFDPNVYYKTNRKGMTDAELSVFMNSKGFNQEQLEEWLMGIMKLLMSKSAEFANGKLDKEHNRHIALICEMNLVYTVKVLDRVFDVTLDERVQLQDELFLIMVDGMTFEPLLRVLDTKQDIMERVYNLAYGRKCTLLDKRELNMP